MFRHPKPSVYPEDAETDTRGKRGNLLGQRVSCGEKPRGLLTRRMSLRDEWGRVDSSPSRPPSALDATLGPRESGSETGLAGFTYNTAIERPGPYAKECGECMIQQKGEGE